MSQTPKSNPSLHQQDVGEWLTKSQLARINRGTKAEIDALVKLGYLTPIRIGPRLECYWSTDAENAIRAFRSDAAPPTPTKFAKKPMDWGV